MTANPSVLTCLANDVGYENIFTEQLKAFSNKNDIALAFSGSGNSANVVEALEWCEVNGMETYAILGYSGGKAAKIAKNAIHIAVDDMQISEDLQLIIGHIIMQWIAEHEGLKKLINNEFAYTLSLCDFSKQNNDLVIDQVELPTKLEVGQVLVKFHYSGICEVK